MSEVELVIMGEAQAHEAKLAERATWQNRNRTALADDGEDDGEGDGEGDGQDDGQAYRQQLAGRLDPILRRALEDGDWDTEDLGQARD